MKKLAWATSLLLGLFSTTAATAQSATVSQIIRPDNLNIQIPYLERMAGPAKRVQQHRGYSVREYSVGGCDMNVYVRSGQVVSYSVRTGNPACSFDLSQFVMPSNEPLPEIGRLTMGMIAGTGYMQTLYAPCLASCGNAYDPYAELVVRAPRVANFMEVRALAILTDTADWTDTIQRERGAVYLESGRYNCDERYQELGIAAMRDARVLDVEVGFGIMDRTPRCPAVGRRR